MNRCFPTDRRPAAPWFALGMSIVLLPTLLGGCVALNIPSVRYDDPEDRGGLFGPHRKTDASAVPELTDVSGLADGRHACTSGSEDLEIADPPKPPEVPWPRFHPLPTRPVFAPLAH